MPFDDGLITVSRCGDDGWQLVYPLRYVGAVDTFEVPAGYRTDFASVPRIAVWLIPRFGRWTAAAILHDYLITDALPAGLLTPVDVDGLFRRILREEGVPPVKRYLMWAGVRWGALVNPRRRAGWVRTAPQVLAITAAGLPLAPVMAAVALGLAAYGLAEALATRGEHTGTLST
jgi:Protein of unknown function (DUF1353)